MIFYKQAHPPEIRSKENEKCSKVMTLLIKCLLLEFTVHVEGWKEEFLNYFNILFYNCMPRGTNRCVHIEKFQN
jgi:hypothetical protein